MLAPEARILRAMAFADDHLGEALPIARVAAAAGLSAFHFHRAFRSAVGEPVHAHIRRLRLERAAFELARSRDSVKRIGIQSGYRTPSAFVRAFAARFGRTPLVWRARALPATAHELRDVPSPRCYFAPVRHIAFMRRIGPMLDAYPAAWEALAAMPLARATAADGAIGLFADYPGITASADERHDAAIILERAPDALEVERAPDALEGVALRTLPAGWYAVFAHQARRDDLLARGAMWGRLYDDWAPRLGIRLRSNGAFERYPDRWGPLREGLASIELHVPIEAPIPQPRAVEPIARTDDPQR